MRYAPLIAKLAYQAIFATCTSQSSATWLWPVEDAPCFVELLRAIDEADAELERASEADG
jgi:hypothetical protein